MTMKAKFVSYRFDYNLLTSQDVHWLMWKGNVNRGQWSEGNLREAVRRSQANEISFREAERYFGTQQKP
jgi:hypothetical protein